MFNKLNIAQARPMSASAMLAALILSFVLGASSTALAAYSNFLAGVATTGNDLTWTDGNTTVAKNIPASGITYVFASHYVDHIVQFATFNGSSNLGVGNEEVFTFYSGGVKVKTLVEQSLSGPSETISVGVTADKLVVSRNGSTALGLVSEIQLWDGTPDTTPPAPPTGLTITNITDTAANVSWSANSEPDLAAYKVYLDGGYLTTTTSTSYYISGLAAASAHTIGVSAYDSSGNESAQTTMTFTTAAAPPVPPATPTGLAANVSGYDVALTWSASASATSYQVFRGGVLIGTSITPAYTDAGLAPGTYFYQVAAVDQYNQISALSAAVSAKVYDITPPAPPTGLVATTGGNALDLSWSAPADPDVASYRVYLDGVFWGTVKAPATSYTISGLALSTTYSVYVTAVDTAANESAPSNSATATTSAAPTTPPPAPTGFGAQAKVGAAYLSWDPVPAAAQLALLRDGRLVATLPASTTAYTDPNLPKGPYSYSLVASNSAGSSPPATANVVISIGNIDFTMAFAGLGSQVGAFLSANLNWILMLLGLILGLGLIRLTIDLLRRAAGGDH